MKIVSIINYKGGVGKTTLTANIATELANKGKKVLIIDLDSQTNLTLSFITPQDYEGLVLQGKTIKNLYMDYIRTGTINNLTNLIVRPSIVNSQLIGTGGKIDLISSNLQLIDIDADLASTGTGSTENTIRINYLKVRSILKQSLKSVCDDYDIVLMDCPPNFNIVTQNAITASDFYLIPAKPDYLSTSGIDQLLGQVKILVDKYNSFAEYENKYEGIGVYDYIDPLPLGIVFTMINIYNDKPIQAQQEYITQVKTNVPCNVFNNFIRNNNTLFANAPEYGVPVILNDKQSGDVYDNIKFEIRSLVDELIASVII